MTNINEILSNKAIKPKDKTVALSELLLDNSIKTSELIEFAKTAKDSPKATCIEVLEFATQIKPEIATLECLEFVSDALTSKAPRVKWESAKVIGNIAHLFPDELDSAIGNLLKNTEFDGTVVRWSAAFALGEILKIGSELSKELFPTLQAICQREEKSSIQKLYLSAFKIYNKNFLK